MFAKLSIGLIFVLMSQGLFAYNTNSMKKNYHEDINLPDTILHPLIQDKKIIKIEAKTKHKAKYLGINSIYVKENIENLGKYVWNKKRQAYISPLNRKELIFEAKKIYLISQAKYDDMKTIKNDLAKINKKNLSDHELKDLFSSYNQLSIKEKELMFCSDLVDTLIKNRLIYLKNKEYFLLIDKNKQRGYIFSFHKSNKSLEYIGSDHISTGNPSFNSRNDRYFETPIGIINRARYRRGDWISIKKNAFKYGERKDRIYYLGKYLIPIADKSKFKREVHLAIHSTTPIDAMLLGHKVSKGCIRISRELNKILNKSAIIDGKNGKYVIIIDSSLPIKENLKKLEKFSKEKIKHKRNKYAMISGNAQND
ncbi:MAG: L,D-transpeptidase [Sulfurospirillaceae bacterium]|nr:L,D-transpeptidase [Sulfurospirillaceae bacterium]